MKFSAGKKSINVEWMKEMDNVFVFRLWMMDETTMMGCFDAKKKKKKIQEKKSIQAEKSIQYTYN